MEHVEVAAPTGRRADVERGIEPTAPNQRHASERHVGARAEITRRHHRAGSQHAPGRDVGLEPLPAEPPTEAAEPLEQLLRGGLQLGRDDQAGQRIETRLLVERLDDRLRPQLIGLDVVVSEREQFGVADRDRPVACVVEPGPALDRVGDRRELVDHEPTRRLRRRRVVDHQDRRWQTLAGERRQAPSQLVGAIARAHRDGDRRSRWAGGRRRRVGDRPEVESSIIRLVLERCAQLDADQGLADLTCDGVEEIARFDAAASDRHAHHPDWFHARTHEHGREDIAGEAVERRDALGDVDAAHLGRQEPEPAGVRADRRLTDRAPRADLGCT